MDRNRPHRLYAGTILMAIAAAMYIFDGRSVATAFFTVLATLVLITAYSTE